MFSEVRGERVFASTGGRPFDASRPVIVFLHGSGLDHSFWALHTRYFAFRGYAVLAPDLPGHSLSGGAPLTTIEDMANWMGEWLDALGADRFSFVGHSQGCLVGLDAAARLGPRFRSLSLIASGAATPVNPALIEAAERDPDRAVALMTGWGFGPPGQYFRGPVPGHAMLAAGQRVMRRNAPAALAADLRACDAYEGGPRAAAAVKCPTQVMVGGHDRMAPRRATEALIEALPSPEVHRIEEAGHMIPVETPDRCRRLLSEFIFRHRPADRA